jgi:hypothetical protein
MRNRIIVVLMSATAVGLMLILHPAPLFKNTEQPFAERDLSETDQDAQMVELRQRARAAMVGLQSLQRDADQVRVTGSN